jgi:hypothetical protein
MAGFGVAHSRARPCSAVPRHCSGRP